MIRSAHIALALLALAPVLACQGDPTDSGSELRSVVVTPSAASVVSGRSVEFVASGRTSDGKTVAVHVTWSTNGGMISPNGVLTATAAPGTYQVIATAPAGPSDTSAVTVTEPPPPTRLVLTPPTASTSPGGVVTFFAYGLTSTGDSVDVPVMYNASGGSVASTGAYTAGMVPGTFWLSARSAAGLADTAEVLISTSAVARVTLAPDIAASRSGETIRFSASAFSASGARMSEQVLYRATCGTVTSAGLYTAPSNDGGSCLAIASAGGKADTTEVVLLPNRPGQGIPYGVHSLWTSTTTTEAPGGAAFTASIGHVPASNLVERLAAARAKGVRLVLTMTGGSHELYKTNGVFDLAKWQAAMDRYNTPAVQAAVAEAVTDGTLIGNSVMDEPYQADGMSSGSDKSWGPQGTMTRARVDELCARVKTIFPTLAVGVFHDPVSFQPDSSYRVCQFLVVQYASRKGDIVRWRETALALTSRDGMAVIFSLNLLDGGTQDKSDGMYDCTGTGGLGTYKPNCRMTAEQIRTYGRAIGPAGCALLSWKFDSELMARPEYQAAFSDLAIALSTLPRIPCTGTRPG